MKEFKGTKGPWRVSEERGDMIDIRHGDNSIGAMSLNLARVAARQCWTSEGKANAKLIAAAPELLEALQEIRQSYKDLADSGDAGFWDFDKSEIGMMTAKAIAKAVGESK